jgi:hypothetical protein
MKKYKKQKKPSRVNKCVHGAVFQQFFYFVGTPKSICNPRRLFFIITLVFYFVPYHFIGRKVINIQRYKLKHSWPTILTALSPLVRKIRKMIYISLCSTARRRISAGGRSDKCYRTWKSWSKNKNRSRFPNIVYPQPFIFDYSFITSLFLNVLNVVFAFDSVKTSAANRKTIRTRHGPIIYGRVCSSECGRALSRRGYQRGGGGGTWERCPQPKRHEKNYNTIRGANDKNYVFFFFYSNYVGIDMLKNTVKYRVNVTREYRLF